MEEIVNKVSQSGLVTFNLEDLYDQSPMVSIDLKDNLFQGLILREKDFRQFVKETDWEQYQDSNVALFCSADAVVPTWAYMLVSNRLAPFAANVFFGTPDQLQQHLIQQKIDAIDLEELRDQRIVVKGCSNFEVPIGAYVALTTKLSPVAKSIMYGEPCSTVPIYKRKA
jgi:Protein of unknown function (DUF2480)